jgi:hypothetical protein
MTGKGMVGGRIAPNSAGAFFWVSTLIVLGSTSTISGILAARALAKGFTRSASFQE